MLTSLGCGPAVGSTGEGESTGEDTSGGSSPSTSSPSTSSTTIDESSSDATTQDVVDESSTGAPPPTWCIEVHDLVGPDGALEGQAAPARFADVDGDDRLELWTVVSTWDPLLEETHVVLTQHDVDASGVADARDVVELAGELVRFADIDGDHHDDVVFLTNGDATPQWIDVQTGEGEPQPIDAPDVSGDLWFDADGDGAVDIFVLGTDDAFVEVWIGDATGSFDFTSQLGAVFGDMAWLGRLVRVDDGVFAAEADNGAIGFGYAYSMWEIHLDEGVLSTGASTPVLEQALAGAADFDADGLVDFVTLPFDGGSGTHVWHGTAEGPVERVVSEHSGAQLIGDFLGTDARGLLVADAEGNVEIHETPLDETAAPILPQGSIGELHQYEVVDVDGDGKDELVRSAYADDAYAYAVVEVVPCE